MNIRQYLSIPKKYLIALSGVVWAIAGFNVLRIGIIAYARLTQITLVVILLTLLIFALFGKIFFNMVRKNILRIHQYNEEKRPFWNFFALKSYMIMAVMMTVGIWLRNSGLASDYFIAFFYFGLGSALGGAGILFLIAFFKKAFLNLQK